MFDVKKYWKNRKAGKRGQGEPVGKKIRDKVEGDRHFNMPQHVVPVGKGFKMMNRHDARAMGQNAHND
jgi:hypothetical protein